MIKHTILSLMLCGLSLATESFDNLNKGGLTTASLTIGSFTAEQGHAAIYGKGHSGSQCLHITGGANKSATITLDSPLKSDTKLNFQAERWTRRAPFQFTVIAVTPEGEKQAAACNNVSVGGFHPVDVTLPAGTTAIRFVATTDDRGGVLIDDIDLHVGPMTLKNADMVNPGVFPIMKRAAFNPVFAYKIQTSGNSDALNVSKLTFKVDCPESVQNVTLRTGSPNGLDFSKSTTAS